MKRIFISLGLVVIFIVAIGILTQKLNNKQINLNPKSTSSLTQIKVGNTKISIEIAATQEARITGLSGRKSLAEDTGMLFVFDQKNTVRSFWMKGMEFPLWRAKSFLVISLLK